MVEKGELKLKDELAKLRLEFDNVKAKNVSLQTDMNIGQEKLLHLERENERLLNKMGTFEKVY